MNYLSRLGYSRDLLKVGNFNIEVNFHFFLERKPL